jgi:DNA-binding transcriptional MocR family regulator
LIISINQCWVNVSLTPNELGHRLPHMNIALERGGGRERRTVYRQISDHIRLEVADGRLEAGDRLPPIRNLARDLGVNRDTVALAYEELVNAGVAVSTVGRGTFVAPARSSGTPEVEDFQPSLAPLTERLLDFEHARPRFGSVGNAVPMHSLVPDQSLYPADEFRRVLNRVLQRSGPELLLYGSPQGHLGLRETLAERFQTDGIRIDANGIVLCHGASQGISLGLRLFAQAGDVVAVEEPTYSNALAAVHGLGLKIAPVPMRGAGPDLAALDRILARPEVKVFYTIPTFHNPLGTTTSVNHRHQLLEIAARHRKPVIEDGYETDLRFSGRPIPSLAALDRTGLVLHLFSFSKSLFPGARVGAITAHGRLIEALLALKQATDLSDALPLQAALAEFAASGAYDRHLGRVRRVLRERCDALLDALEVEMPRGARWTRPDGGLQVWVELPEGIDTRDLLSDAAVAGVFFAPGSQFNHDGRSSNCLRLTFAMAEPEALRFGVSVLARVVAERLEGKARINSVQI